MSSELDHDRWHRADHRSCGALRNRVAHGADAYFKYVNAHGGVNGFKIHYVYLDDAYDPSKTVQLTRQLVEQDHVFAIFNTVGTENNIAIRDYLNAARVPQLFGGTGTARIGDDLQVQTADERKPPTELPRRRLDLRPLDREAGEGRQGWRCSTRTPTSART